MSVLDLTRLLAKESRDPERLEPQLVRIQECRVLKMW